MGLNQQQPRATWLSISDGLITQRVKDPSLVKDARERIIKNKDGTQHTIWERVFASVDGVVKKVEVRSSDFNGKHIAKSQYAIWLSDGEDMYVLTMPYSSSYTKYLLNGLMNIEDLTQVIRIKPWKFFPKDTPGKYKIGVTIYTGSLFQTKVEPLFSKEDGQMPPMTQIKVKGEMVSDDSAQMEWFEEQVRNIILPRLPQALSFNTVEFEAETDTNDKSFVESLAKTAPPNGKQVKQTAVVDF